MMRYIKAFFMAWSCFSIIPCPYRSWDESLRDKMLCTFPLIGTGNGLITAAAWKLLDHLSLGGELSGAILTGLCFYLTGWIHIDGFMDCSDAIYSRRPKLEDRQRILKDSHVGAFAVIAFSFILLLFYGAMCRMTEEFSPGGAGALILILSLSRGCSAYAVLHRTPMESSQYGNMHREKESERRSGKINTGEISVLLVCSVLIPALLSAALVLFWLHADNSLLVWGKAAVLAFVSAVPVSWITGILDRKLLGGMNGDISGHMILRGETAGIVAISAFMPFIG